MISLVLIPLFCLCHFYKVEAFKTYVALDFSLPDKEDFEKYKVGNLRKYKVFYFNGEKSKELRQLKELRVFARNMIEKYDTINGAKIRFGSKTDYDTFISVINIMSEEKMPTWALFSDNLYALANSKPKSTKRHSFVCGTNAYSVKRTLQMQEENRKKELDIFQASFFKQQWILFLAYFILVLLNIFALVKFNKNQNYNQK
ncbi:hypothetical protein [Flavobacterium gyeonganense]|nr:hypothetical protein [Flavobacterium gyeonganense]